MEFLAPSPSLDLIANISMQLLHFGVARDVSAQHGPSLIGGGF
jgi:hypothetical protein